MWSTALVTISSYIDSITYRYWAEHHWCRCSMSKYKYLRIKIDVTHSTAERVGWCYTSRGV